MRMNVFTKFLAKKGRKKCHKGRNCRERIWIIILSLQVFCCCSVAKLYPTFLWPHGLQHARLPCPSLSPGVCSDSCPLSQWCHSNIPSLAASFSFCLQYFPALGSFPMSWLFASGGQSSGASASTSVLPVDPIFLFWCYCLSQRSSVDSQCYPAPEPMRLWSGSHTSDLIQPRSQDPLNDSQC